MNATGHSIRRKIIIDVNHHEARLDHHKEKLDYAYKIRPGNFLERAERYLTILYHEYWTDHHRKRLFGV